MIFGYMKAGLEFERIANEEYDSLMISEWRVRRFHAKEWRGEAT
ncbi:hypothetical protein [Bacillus sp. cl95]|nr:hypothetical protein [Bacillus sp. cl95]SFB03204.1 hypothetical protein SAMN02799634_104162 [Bacillus sp. UNCCL13]SFQ88855.1 hypothetical protein SAMN04488577_3351 [Bacillus sp. cl95]